MSDPLSLTVYSDVICPWCYVGKRRLEAALDGAAATSAAIAHAAKKATSGAKPLPMTGYKLDLLQGLVRDLLEQVAK